MNRLLFVNIAWVVAVLLCAASCGPPAAGIRKSDFWPTPASISTPQPNESSSSTESGNAGGAGENARSEPEPEKRI